MKFYVSSVKYSIDNNILTLPITHGDIAQELSVELNTVEDFVRFSEEVNNNKLIIDVKDRTIEIYDYYVE